MRDNENDVNPYLTAVTDESPVVSFYKSCYMSYAEKKNSDVGSMGSKRDKKRLCVEK